MSYAGQPWYSGANERWDFLKRDQAQRTARFQAALVNGQSFDVYAGTSGATTGQGGAVTITGGSGGGSLRSGGAVTLQGGSSAAAAGLGGSIMLSSAACAAPANRLMASMNVAVETTSAVHGMSAFARNGED